jgi:hypothetical protein
MIYFCGVLLWISQHFEEIEEQKADSSRLVLLVVFEELDLAEALFRFFPSLVWATEILAFLFRNDFIPALYFLDHPDTLLSPIFRHRAMRSIRLPL